MFCSIDMNTPQPHKPESRFDMLSGFIDIVPGIEEMVFRHRGNHKSRRLTADLATKQPDGLCSSWRHEMLAENSRLGRRTSQKLSVLCLSVRPNRPPQSRPSDGTSSASACACAESYSVSFVTWSHCFLAITTVPMLRLFTRLHC